MMTTKLVNKTHVMLVLLILGCIWAGVTSAQSAATVSVVNHPALGDILVGPKGMTLYILSKESANAIACVEDCALNWLPLIVTRTDVVVAGLEASNRAQVNTATRSSEGKSQLQVSYKGQPLYSWSRDKVPGDVTGDGIGGIWSVARP
jgi:predicted lipoprotein with Yx(FWY)xxD motif